MSREKQIEEMVKITKALCELDNQCGSCHWETCNECFAEALYNAGYRKQSEGEWIWDRDHSNYKCSLCGECDIGVPKFCRECGAKMKGGAE